jgi:hypothetical protein
MIVTGVDLRVAQEIPKLPTGEQNGGGGKSQKGGQKSARKTACLHSYS